MPWVKHLFLITMAVMTVSSLGVGRDAFSDMDVPYDSTTSATISFGKLIIGNGVGSTLLNDTDERQGHAQFPLAEAKLKHLGPSVHCGDDAMTLRVPGPRMPHFLVDRGDGTKVPVSEIPASCGYSVKRVRRDVSLVAPYRGCHVQRQGGSYVQPLLFLGAPVQMSCPVTTPVLPTVSCFPSGMVVSLGQRADTTKIKVGGSWQPLLLVYFKCKFTLDTVDGALVVNAPFKGTCWEIKDSERRLPMLYGGREVRLACPDMPPTTAAPQDPQVPQVFYPFPYGQPWYIPAPTTAAPTTTTAAPQDPLPQQPSYPIGYPWWWYPQVPATQAPTTTTAAPQDPLPQQPSYPIGYPWWWYQQVPATQAPTTTTAAPQDPLPQQPSYPIGYPWWWYQQVPATQPPTTTTAAPQDPFPQQPMFPFPIFDLFYNDYKGQPYSRRHHHHHHHHHPYGVPKFPPFIPGYPFPTLPTVPTPAPPADLPKGMQYPAAQPDMYPGNSMYPFYGPKQVKWPFIASR